MLLFQKDIIKILQRYQRPARTTASFGKEQVFGVPYTGDLHAIQQIFDTFKAHGHNQLDTARRYGAGTTETVLAEIGYDTQGFIVDTKVLSGAPQAHTKENVVKSIDESLKQLNTKKVNIMYLHAPDRTTPFKETLEAINEEYKKGHFEKFGLSNYKAEEVEEIVKIAKENNYVVPTVYQGSYSLIARSGEGPLFPVLRKHNISFYAFSPLAGSFLTGAITRDKHNARFDPSSFIGKMYSDLFCKESHFQVLDELEKLASANSLSIPQIALRWLAHHSQLKREFGDSIIIGGKTLSNIQNSLEWLDQPALPTEVLEVVERISQKTTSDASPYHM